MTAPAFSALLLGLAVLCTVASVWAAVVARRVARQLVSFSKVASTQSPPMKKFADLELEVADLRELYGALMNSHKRLRSREGMRDKRARDEDEANGDWKAAARKRYAAQLQKPGAGI